MVRRAGGAGKLHLTHECHLQEGYQHIGQSYNPWRWRWSDVCTMYSV